MSYHQDDLFMPIVSPMDMPAFQIPVVTLHAPVEIEAEPQTIEAKIKRAEAALGALLHRGNACLASWSAGKDSSCVLSLLLNTAVKLKAGGVALPPIVVTFADTKVENPSMASYARDEMAQVRAFAKKHGLPVRVETAYPNLSSQWAVRVIGGRGLPTFPSTNRDCSTDMKVLPLQKLRKKVLKELAKEGASSGEPVVLIGTRYEESQERARNMRERGESDLQVRRGVGLNGKPSHLFLSPVCFWTTDDVWEYLGNVNAGVIESYSTFEETFRIYADSMGTSCVIVAEDMYKSIKKSKPCSARTGCSICTAVSSDRSMEHMLANEERYSFMQGLNNLRNFLSNTRWDMDRRSWVGRTINNGFIRIGPDAYSPSMMEELLRYALTLDILEKEAAYSLGIKARFELIGIEQLFAIDAMWSLQAFHRPFHALKIWDDIVNKGMRYTVPVVPVYARPKEIPSKYIHVGADWDEGDSLTYTGLRSALHDLASMDSGGCMGNRALPDGRSVLAIGTAELLEFDLETACFVLYDWLDELLEKHHDNPDSSPTQAYLYYAGLEMMNVKKGMEGEIDKMLKRSNFKVRQGLDGQQDPQALLARAMTPEEAGFAAKTTKRRVRGADGSKSVDHGDALIEKPASHDEELIGADSSEHNDFPQG